MAMFRGEDQGLYDVSEPVSYDIILKKDKRLGWKLEVYGNKTMIIEVLDSLESKRKRYLKRRIEFIPARATPPV